LDKSETLKPALRFYTNSSSALFVLHQNQPNPFTENTAIDFYLPQPDYVSLSILDETGKIHYRSEGYYEKGNHTVTVPGGGFAGGGVSLPNKRSHKKNDKIIIFKQEC